MNHPIRTALGAAIALAALQLGANAQGIALNEIYASHSGSDTLEFIELKGPAGASLDNYMVLIVEGEGSLTNQGTLDRAWDLTGYTIPTSGYFVLGEPAVTPAPDFIINFFGTGQDTIENGTETFYLVDAGNSTNVAAILALLATDIDPDNDNLTTIPTLSTVVDSIALIDGDAVIVPTSGILDHAMDNAPTAGPDGVCNPTPPINCFLPGGVFRGLDFPNPWCPEFLDFNATTNATEPRTPGALNSVCPSAPTIINYCTAGTTTNGCTALMGYTGTPSVSLGAGGFTVTCGGIEGAKLGIIFYSISGQNTTAWGTGTSFLCVKTPTQRTQANNTGGTVNLCDGAMSLDFFNYVTNVNPIALGTPFVGGSQAWFQCWFRDPPAAKTTSLSDGLEVTFIP